jgi:hypothetical protein
MRRSLAIAWVALAVTSGAGDAQMFVELKGGALLGTPLVRDSIVQAFTIVPSIAPTVAVAAGTQLSDLYSLALSVRWARSDLVRREAGQTTAVLPLTVWSGSIALRRQVTQWATVEAEVGGIKYATGGMRDGTLFQDDAPLLPAVGVSARADRGIGSGWTLGIETHYDFHRFTTQALRAGGLTGHRSVHRVAATLVVRRTFGNTSQ